MSWGSRGRRFKSGRPDAGQKADSKSGVGLLGVLDQDREVAERPGAFLTAGQVVRGAAADTASTAESGRCCIENLAPRGRTGRAGQVARFKFSSGPRRTRVSPGWGSGRPEAVTGISVPLGLTRNSRSVAGAMPPSEDWVVMWAP